MSMIAPDKRKFTDFNWNTKDRPRKWEDIFLDTPNYEEVKYETDDTLYQKRKNFVKKKKPRKNQKPSKEIENYKLKSRNLFRLFIFEINFTLTKTFNKNKRSQLNYISAKL